MGLALKGLGGALRKQTFPLKPGMTLGRQGDVAIKDGKSSSIHAHIRKSPSGWELVDNDSKNGTRIRGERFARIKLKPGVSFFIGDQGFEVIEIADEPVLDQDQDVTPLAAAPEGEKTATAAPRPATINPADVETATLHPAGAQPEQEPPPDPDLPPPPARKNRRYWHQILAEFLAENKDAFKDRKRPVSPFQPALVLDFVLGVQLDAQWTIGYGPRRVGPASVDLPIWEPGAPAVCFEISPSTQGILFKTAHPDMVLLNGRSVDSQVLRVGDTIRILDTLIEVDFSE